MVASNIKVYLRVRPCGKSSPSFQADPDRGSVTFELDKLADAEVNNSKLTHAYRFDGILPMSASQDDVLKAVAKPVIDDVLNGVNGTIFAYGQTGSGKTFTITGGAQRFADRGLIPRTISYMFEAFRKSEYQYKMYISYLEIYQKAGYDLLRDDSAQQLEDLPKVTLREDEDGNMHLRNLSVNVAASEEDALNLLFLGDTNRVVAETPMNDASTRSHCLFIIWIDSVKPGSDVVRRSKLHLVDLAGSERVSKTGVQGKLLQEATDINLSLHYLERVIVALHARSKGQAQHVPYRDSMMTSVLRDSLGGNCRTTMVGCIAVEPCNVPESISTCNFAQRVAQIQNNAKVNEELDPNLLIARLKREVAELKEEVRVAKGSADGEEEEALTDADVDKCRALVLQYVSDNADPKEPFVCGSVERLRASFRILRDLCNCTGPADGTTGSDGTDPARTAALEAEARSLELEIAQSDQEIAIMVQMLSKRRGEDGRPFIAASPPRPTLACNAVSTPPETEGTNGLVPRQRLDEDSMSPNRWPPLPSGNAARAAEALSAGSPPSSQQESATEANTNDVTQSARQQPKAKSQQRRVPGARQQPSQMPPIADAAELLLDSQRAFDFFRRTVYKPQESFEENKTLLKDYIAAAKVLGDAALVVRQGINEAKVRLEKLRTERAMTAAGYDDAAIEDGPEELAEVQEIERCKALFREKTEALRAVKSDIDMIQRLLEQSKVKMQREFETWFVHLRRRASMDALDEDTKRELYERVVGNSGTNTRASTPLIAAAHAASPLSGASIGSTGTKPPAIPATQRPSAPTTPSTRSGASSATPVPPSITNVQAIASPHPASGLVTQRGTEPTTAIAAAVPPAAGAVPSASGTPTSLNTGDAKTDSDIAAFYAALGDLARR